MMTEGLSQEPPDFDGLTYDPGQRVISVKFHVGSTANATINALGTFWAAFVEVPSASLPKPPFSVVDYAGEGEVASIPK
jgi:hypothetical protein